MMELVMKWCCSDQSWLRSLRMQFRKWSFRSAEKIDCSYIASLLFVQKRHHSDFLCPTIQTTRDSTTISGIYLLIPMRLVANISQVNLGSWTRSRVCVMLVSCWQCVDKYHLRHATRLGFKICSVNSGTGQPECLSECTSTWPTLITLLDFLLWFLLRDRFE